MWDKNIGVSKNFTERVIVLLPGSPPSPYWSPYWICTQHPTCQWSAIHETNALREVLWHWVGKFLLKSTLVIKVYLSNILSAQLKKTVKYLLWKCAELKLSSIEIHTVKYVWWNVYFVWSGNWQPDKSEIQLCPWKYRLLFQNSAANG